MNNWHSLRRGLTATAGAVLASLPAALAIPLMLVIGSFLQFWPWSAARQEGRGWHLMRRYGPGKIAEIQ